MRYAPATVLGLFLLLAGCAQRQVFIDDETKNRRTKQHEFEETYTDTDGGAD